MAVPGRYLSKHPKIFSSYGCSLFLLFLGLGREGESTFGLTSVCHRAQTSPSLINGHDAL